MVNVREYWRGGRKVKEHTRSAPRRSRATAAVAITLALTGVTGGTSAVEGSASSFDYSSTRASRSGSERARGTEVRIKRDSDSFRATVRLRQLGGHPTTLDAQSDKTCAEHSDGGLRVFFDKNRCASLYRTLIEYTEGNYVIRFSTATIEMPDYDTALGLNELLSREDGGNITPLSSNSGKYRNIPFVSGPSTTILHGKVVRTYGPKRLAAPLAMQCSPSWQQTCYTVCWASTSNKATSVSYTGQIQRNSHKNGCVNSRQRPVNIRRKRPEVG